MAQGIFPDQLLNMPQTVKRNVGSISNNIGGGSDTGPWSANNSILSAQDDKLVAYWKGEDTSDSVGSNTLTNNGTATFTAGKNNNAFTLNGTNQYLTFADTADIAFANGDFTIAPWVKFDTTSGDEAIFGQWDNGTNSFLLIHYHAQNKTYFFYNNGGVVAPMFDWTPAADTWYNLVISRIGADLKFYVNGTQTGSTHNIGTSTLVDSADVGLIGASGVGANTFDGQIDEIPVWKGYGATQTFVTALYNGGDGSFRTV